MSVARRVKVQKCSPRQATRHECENTSFTPLIYGGGLLARRHEARQDDGGAHTDGIALRPNTSPTVRWLQMLPSHFRGGILHAVKRWLRHTHKGPSVCI